MFYILNIDRKLNDEEKSIVLCQTQYFNCQYQKIKIYPILFADYT